MNDPASSAGPSNTGTMHTSSFYAFKSNLPQQSEIQGNHDLLTTYGLGPVEGGFTGSRRVKEKLCSFLPHIIGSFHLEATKEASSLSALIAKPPIHKEISNLSSSSMQGFKLSAGPVDERYRQLFERRKDDVSLSQFEKTSIIRVKQSYDPYGFEEDDTEKGFPKKHKKKKKEKKKKKDKDKDSGESSEKRKRLADEPMEF